MLKALCLKKTWLTKGHHKSSFGFPIIHVDAKLVLKKRNFEDGSFELAIVFECLSRVWGFLEINLWSWKEEMVWMFIGRFDGDWNSNTLRHLVQEHNSYRKDRCVNRKTEARKRKETKMRWVWNRHLAKWTLIWAEAYRSWCWTGKPGESWEFQKSGLELSPMTEEN